MDHESISLQIMQWLNREMQGSLSTAIEIFTNQLSEKISTSAGIRASSMWTEWIISTGTVFLPVFQKV